MGYRKINLELIVFADDTDAVVEELKAELDRLEERHTIFGGGIESVAVERRETRKKTALMHTSAADGKAVHAVKAASGKVANALREII
jgi:hypothetical protein